MASEFVTVCVGCTPQQTRFIEDMILKDDPEAKTFPLVIDPDGDAPKVGIGEGGVLRFHFVDGWGESASPSQVKWIVDRATEAISIPIEFDEEHVAREIEEVDLILGNISD